MNFRLSIRAFLWQASLAICGLLVLGAAEKPGVIVGKLALPKTAKARHLAVEKYTGSISGKVASPPQRVAGVWLTREGLTAGATPPVRLTQKGYQFGQSLLIVPLGTEVTFPNEDPDYHNVFSLSRSKRFDLGRYKTGERPAPTRTFDKVGLIHLRCEIHEHMQANILVVDSPFFATTDADGNFNLKNIPPGTYTLHAQLDKKTSWIQQVTVRTGKTTSTQPRLTKKR